MLDTRLFLVTGRAALRRDLAWLTAFEGMAAAALDALLEHVRSVSRDDASDLPGLLDADAWLRVFSTCRDHGRHQHGREQEDERGLTPPGHAAMLLLKTRSQASS
jgi:hypothetical protein